MSLKHILENKQIDISQLSKMTSISVDVLMDIREEKLSLKDCKAITIYKISKALGISVEDLLTPELEEKESFANFKQKIYHDIENFGALTFLVKNLELDTVSTYEEKQWEPECLYVLATIDYISRINRIPLYAKYNKLRQRKAFTTPDLEFSSHDTPIPEFLRHNIVETKLRRII